MHTNYTSIDTKKELEKLLESSAKLLIVLSLSLIEVLLTRNLPIRITRL